MRLRLPRAFLAVAALFWLSSASTVSAMTFSLQDLDDPSCGAACPKVIVASGEIELDSNDKFFNFVRSEVVGRKVASLMLMSSPGGNLVGSIKLGMIVRQLGFSIMVGQVRSGSFLTARCYSACAYTLAGGKSRIVPEGSEVGVHKAWTKATGQRDILGGGTIDGQVSTEGFSPVLERYLGMMGVSRQLVALADGTPSTSIRVLSRGELSQLRVMTGARPQKKRRANG
ncbi:MAG: hypothetical protein NTZ14_00195 [Hyphomicrobiales bacterium]|nr:hypothetical protein [Hyphomicrobiales bacterium]